MADTELKRAETDPTPEVTKSAAPKAAVSHFTKPKRWKKRVILVLVLVAAAFLAWKFLIVKAPPAVPVMSTALAKAELVNSVSLTGTVESAQVNYIYSKLGSTINSVTVKVGDKVEQGTLLAQLDTTDLEIDIAQQTASLTQKERSNNHAMEVTKNKLEDAKSDIVNDVDANLITAENSLRAAQQELNNARRDLTAHKDDLEYADTVMNELERKLNRAREDMDDAEKAWKVASRPGSTTSAAEIATLKKAYDDKETAYKVIFKEWTDKDHAYGADLTPYSRNYRNARVAYENVLASKNAIENNVNRTLDTLEQNIKGQAIDNDLTASQLALKKLQKNLTDSTVTAPISGTVTAVYAKVGAPGNGLLFVIEDTEQLIIKTKVKEYDIATVKVGMPAEIKLDATGDKELAGKVSHIYPTAVKNADGSTKTDGGIEFETEISIDSPQKTDLRVGMNTRLTIVTAKKENVWSVPFDAVSVDPQGQDIVYVARPAAAQAGKAAEGAMISVAVPVTTGMETDFYIEVTSDALVDGDQIISDASTVTMPGAPVVLMSAGGAAVAGA